MKVIRVDKSETYRRMNCLTSECYDGFIKNDFIIIALLFEHSSAERSIRSAMFTIYYVLIISVKQLESFECNDKITRGQQHNIFNFLNQLDQLNEINLFIIAAKSTETNLSTGVL